MVLTLCGGSPPMWSSMPATRPRVVSFPWSEVKRLTGLDVPKERSPRHPDLASASTFRVPASASRSRRRPGAPDVDGKADLVEEVMRIHGVDNIAPRRCRA
jgi:phenylalanyl-tRNA synthetase beta chain